MLNDFGVNGIFDFFRANLSYLKALSIFLTVFMFGATIFFAIKTGWIATRVDRVRDVVLKSDLPKKRTIKAWRNITHHYFAGDEANLKLALIESDKVLDDALKIAGYRGETLGDRLKQLTHNDLSVINEIWEAHKLRNQIVHEQNFRLDRKIAERSLAVYRKAFEELGLLE